MKQSFNVIQQLKRDIIAGRYCAPHAPRRGPDNPKSRKRKLEVVPGWNNEEAYFDNFYGNNGDNDLQDLEEGFTEDCVPNYFHDCEQLLTNYSKMNFNTEDDIPSRPLYEGSQHSAKDLARFLLSFKARHLKVGDGIIANVFSVLATFLPPDNTLEKYLPRNPTTYYILKTLDNLASYSSGLRTLKIHVCVNNCMGYYAQNSGLNFCTKCGACRWKLCSSICYDETGAKNCSHSQNPVQTIYYNIVQDRLVKLLKSDLKLLFYYDTHRTGNTLYFQLLLNNLCSKLIIFV